MVKRRIKQETAILLKTINNAILEKKGEELLNLNLTEIENTVAEYFIICHANSSTQVNAIANSIEEMVKKNTGEKPWKKEGYSNSEWVLLDYVNVVVHVFQTQSREFYKLEKLWADAETTLIND
ncbi:MAG: ribosome silencing factor [Bacteroidales bacterium]|jgi:ribosome-associated protein|nr:ribosome silencing factor [Bacteroidales bacterium]MDD4217886.1 ribosome silencing factor [Bacteroidales bacterium]MDY0141719.1 ribosome silencing factor [Bacteroidales bacterium]